jgi:hypothetical protein
MFGMGQQRQRDRERARELARQTAARKRARDTRLVALGLRLNDNDTVTGTAEHALVDGARVEIRFDNYPAVNALEAFTREIDRLRAGLVGLDNGWVDVRIGGAPMQARARITEDSSAAQAKAQETLRSFLNEDQRKTYRDWKYFEVVGSKGTLYRIKTDGNASGNVLWRRSVALGGSSRIDAGRYCAYPKGYTPDGRYLPVEDQFLGQMLQLITDEDSFLDSANLFSGNYPTHHPKHAAYARRMAAEGRLTDVAPCDCAVCKELVATMVRRPDNYAGIPYPGGRYYQFNRIGRIGGPW